MVRVCMLLLFSGRVVMVRVFMLSLFIGHSVMVRVFMLSLFIGHVSWYECSCCQCSLVMLSWYECSCCHCSLIMCHGTSVHVVIVHWSCFMVRVVVLALFIGRDVIVHWSCHVRVVIVSVQIRWKTVQCSCQCSGFNAFNSIFSYMYECTV